MRPAKPNGLVTRARTKEETTARAAAESSMTPSGDVFASLPPNLKGHAVAKAIWDRLASLYHDMEAKVVCQLDRDLLVDYCLLAEQVVELDAVRKKVLANLGKRGGIVFIDEFTKVDARVDRKRALLLQLRQSLYLTPRARAGVVPEGKPAPEPVDPLEALLEDVKM